MILLGSCSKEKDLAPDKYAEDSITIPEGLDDYDGLMVAVRNYISKVEITEEPIVQDVAYSEFKVDGKFADVGQVKLNNKILFRVPSNQYVSLPDDENFKLNEGSKNVWNAGGKSGFPKFEKILTVSMPGLVIFDEVPSEISLSQGFSAKVKNVPTHTISLIWVLKDVEGNSIQKTTKTSEVTFTPSDMSSLKPGIRSLIKVAAYSIEEWSHEGKTFFFLNQTTDLVNAAFK